MNTTHLQPPLPDEIQGHEVFRSLPSLMKFFLQYSTYRYINDSP